MLEGIVLGIVQGVAEWLPVSSEGLLVLTQVTFFEAGSLEALIRKALFLHLGTFLAALVYFWKDVARIISSLFNYKQSTHEQKNLIKFLVVSTLISGVVGLLLISLLSAVFESNEHIGVVITALVGVLLLITGLLQLKAKEGGVKQLGELGLSDSILLGVVQGCAALPGLSRSGLTVSALLLRKYSKELSLKLSFLMSLPIVLGGNIVANVNSFEVTQESIYGLVFAFVFGLITIDILLRVAKKINFGYFVLLFAALTLASLFI